MIYFEIILHVILTHYTLFNMLKPYLISIYIVLILSSIYYKPKISIMKTRIFYSFIAQGITPKLFSILICLLFALPTNLSASTESEDGASQQYTVCARDECGNPLPGMDIVMAVRLYGPTGPYYVNYSGGITGEDGCITFWGPDLEDIYFLAIFFKSEYENPNKEQHYGENGIIDYYPTQWGYYLYKNDVDYNITSYHGCDNESTNLSKSRLNDLCGADGLKMEFPQNLLTNNIAVGAKLYKKNDAGSYDLINQRQPACTNLSDINGTTVGAAGLSYESCNDGAEEHAYIDYTSILDAQTSCDESGEFKLVFEFYCCDDLANPIHSQSYEFIYGPDIELADPSFYWAVFNASIEDSYENTPYDNDQTTSTRDQRLLNIDNSLTSGTDGPILGTGSTGISSDVAPTNLECLEGIMLRLYKISQCGLAEIGPNDATLVTSEDITDDYSQGQMNIIFQYLNGIGPLDPDACYYVEITFTTTCHTFSEIGKFKTKNCMNCKIDKKPATQITMYPTISDGFMNIEFDNPILNEMDVNVYNLSGYNVYKEILPKETKNSKLNLSDLPKGVYFVNFNGRNLQDTKKVIIQ
ncbi:MAG: T9SS type A sorting domain-containing protein [Candidatus Cyclobacteriaceae bacterium M2_1C_046]